MTQTALSLALDPVTKETFLAESWERRPLAVAREQPNRFEGLLSTADVERLVCSSGIRHPGLRLVKEGATLPLQTYTETLPWRPSPLTETARVGEVLAAFQDGATIVLQALHVSWEPLALFCRELERELGQATQANAYYTPRSSQGFAVHHDTHDVLVLQVAGEKRWLLYEPALELPLREQAYSPDRHASTRAPIDELMLRAGDTLYLPRGWLHQALTSDSDSLHITLGINVYTWQDAFRAALAACAADAGFRHSVPTGGEGAERLLEALAARLRPAEVVRRRRRALVEGRRPLLGGQLSQLRALDHLAAETFVERRPTTIADLERRDGRAILSFEGKTVSLPAKVWDELEFIYESTRPFRIGELPGDLDEPGRLVLIRRLVREGFLRTAAPTAPVGR